MLHLTLPTLRAHEALQKPVPWLHWVCASGWIIASTVAVQAASLTATSRVSDVTLYPDGATVTRSFALELPGGSHEIIIPDLPMSADANSLRIEGRGAARFSLGGIDIKLGVTEPEPDRALVQKLKAAREARDRVADRLDALEGRRQMILRLAGRDPVSAASPTLDLEAWLKAVDAVGRSLQTVNDDLREMRRETQRLNEEIAALEQATGRQPQRTPRRQASLAVDVGQAGMAEFTLSYRVAGAQWRPIYDLKLTTTAPKPALEITRRAMLRQQTGEDWKEARITLSTLRLHRGTAAPLLQPDILNFHDPVALASTAVRREAMPMAAPPPAPGQPGMDRERQQVMAEEQQAQLVASAYQAEFVLPGPLSLSSGPEERSVRLASEQIAVELRHRATPILNPTAFLEASAVLPGEAPLIAGEALLSRDGALIGRARLADTAPGEKLQLGFGADERVSLKRVPVKREARDSGLLGATRNEESRFRIDVTNHHAFPVTIEIIDRVPISEDRDIVVTRLPEMTAPDIEPFEDRRGVFAWVAKLEPKASRSFLNAHRIRYPQGRFIRPVPGPGPIPLPMPRNG